MWIFQLKFIPIVYKELIIHRIKKEFNHKELFVLLVMVQQGTACRYPASLSTYSIFTIYLQLQIRRLFGYKCQCTE